MEVVRGKVWKGKGCSLGKAEAKVLGAVLYLLDLVRRLLKVTSLLEWVLLLQVFRVRVLGLVRSLWNRFLRNYGQPCTGGGVGVAQANTVPVNPSCPQTDVSGRTDGSQQFLQQGVFGCSPNVTDFHGSQQVPGVSVLQQQQQQFRLLQQQLQQQSQIGAPPGMWNSAAAAGSPTVPTGPSLRGCTPQQEAMRQIEGLLGSLNPLQLRALSEVVTSQRTLQSRGLPEVFGQVPEVGSGFDFGGDVPNRFRLPGFQAEAGGTSSEVRQPLDIFSKNEKWLGSPPTCDPTKWSTREQEIIGFGSFVDALVS